MNKKILLVLLTSILLIGSIIAIVGYNEYINKNIEEENELNETASQQAKEDFEEMDVNKNGKIDIDEVPGDLEGEDKENMAKFLNSVYQSYQNE